MKTIKDVFDAFKSGLSNLYDLNEVESITMLSINEITGLSKAKIKAFPEIELTDGQSQKLTGILSQLKTGKPIQYILGKTEFYGLPFNVNPSVLIPRPETEELVEWILSSTTSEQLIVDFDRNTSFGIIDIGTGSGCIAISLKKNLPDVPVYGIDISNDAIQTAAQNGSNNGVFVGWGKADILNLDKPSFFTLGLGIGRFSLVVSNPPYVTLHDKLQMHTNVTDFEPHTALFVPENDPLIFYKAIADFAINNLEPNGLLFFEINESYGEQIVDLLKDKGFINIELRKDMSGKDRMVKASLGH
jgi:release factor glutamine methyltransferase